MNGHVKTPSNTSTLQRLVCGIFLSSSNQTGHLVLSELDLLAAKGSKTEVCDLYTTINQQCLVSRYLKRVRTLNFEAGADMFAMWVEGLCCGEVRGVDGVGNWDEMKTAGEGLISL